MVDPHSLTRWKHQWRWHNGDCVWDKIAAGWAGAENWRHKRPRCENAMDKRDFETFALMNVEDSGHAQVQNWRNCQTKQRNKEKSRENWARQRGLSCYDMKRTTVQMYGDGNVAENESLFTARWARSAESQLAESRWEYGVAYPVGKIGYFRETCLQRAQSRG